MATLKLDILAIPTYNTKTLGVADASIYPTDPPDVLSPTIEITVPGFAKISLPFAINNLTIYSSTTLGITATGEAELPLPDGVYFLRYSIAPAYINFVEKSIMRVDRLQEKFDEAFMKLDMMECDGPIKAQAKTDLNSVYFFIQGAIAAANNCAIDEANKLYKQANRMLDGFIGTSNTCVANLNICGNI